MGDIVIADDAPLQRQLIEHFVSEEHRVIKNAENGDEAVWYVSVYKPDLVIMDLNMPVKTGIEAIMNIISLGLDTKILVSTSRVSAISIEEAVSAGADEYLIKPYSKEKLLETISQVTEEM